MVLRSTLVPLDATDKIVVCLDHAEVTLHRSPVRIRRSAPLDKNFRLLVLEGFLALGQLRHDAGDFLLKTEMIALVQLMEERLARACNREIGESRRPARCSFTPSSG